MAGDLPTRQHYTRERPAVHAISGYHYLELVAETFHCRVYRAHSERDDQAVFLKLHARSDPSSEETARFQHEYALLRAIDSPGVIRCLRLEQVGQRPMLVLEDFGGVALSRLDLAGALDLDALLAMAIAIAGSVAQVHRAGVIHKDINPSNIALNQSTGQLKLIDFNLATRLHREEVAFQGPATLEGTLAYISPEQSGRMNRAVDYRTDFYSLGATLYELLAGHCPFRSQDPLELVHAHLARQPEPLHQVDPRIPPAVSAIVLKLLAKSAEDRYQSAEGLIADLAYCREHLGAPASLASFTPGRHDRAERFRIPQTLYGREAEVAQLVAAFERIAVGSRELLLVAGPAGIGKTVLVQELHQPATVRRGHFVSGKFDQYQRATPYRAWTQAFMGLMAQLLTESEARLASSRSALQSALGEHASVIIDLIPTLALVLGPQAPAPRLEGREAQSRLEFALRGFVRALARPEHPLVIFLDDLQWADAASLNLLSLLMGESDTGALLLVGAYRDEEVGPAHALLMTVGDLRQAEVSMTALTLRPLSQEDVNRLSADALACPAELARPFTDLLYQRTRGNPFFTTQLLQVLHDARLIAFNAAAGQWESDLAQVRAFTLGDDVVSFMVEQLQKLPPETRPLLTLAACMGGQFDLTTLALVAGRLGASLQADFWPALEAGLVIPTREHYQFRATPQGDADGSGPSYRFLHDQVQQAAASLVSEGERRTLHLHIGRQLREHTPAAQPAQLFAIVQHLNQGSALLAEQAERDDLARLNLRAGLEARAVAAFAAAWGFFSTGLELLGEGAWVRDYELALRLAEAAAEAAFLCGDFAAMERLAAVVLAEARTPADQLKVFEIQIQGLGARSRFLECVQLGLHALRQLGVAFPEQPSEADVGAALGEIQAVVRAQPIATLIDLPPMSDPAQLAIMRLCASILPAAFTCSPALYMILTFRQVTRSIQHGITPIAIHSYATYAQLLCGVLGDIETGYQFGRLALNLQRRLNAKELECKVLSSVYAFVNHWKDPIRDSLLPLRAAYVSGLETGDYQFAGYAAVMYEAFTHVFGIEQSLVEVREESLALSETLAKIKHTAARQYLQIGLQQMHDLIEGRPSPRYLQGEHYDEQVMLPRHLEANDRLALFVLYSSKNLLNYLFEEYAQALEDAAQAEPYQDGAAGFPYIALYHFYASLTYLAAYRNGYGDVDEVRRKVAANQAKVAGWARHAPANWQHAWDLVEAEHQRTFGHAWEAMEAYDRAIAGASTQGFLRETALANELAAEFYLERGKELLAQAHMQVAAAGYARWGAQAKVAQLEQRHPHLLGSRAPAPQWAISTGEGTDSLSLDLGTVIRASQAIAGEIALDRLLTRLMRLVIENAGAQRGALILERDGAWVVEALGEADCQEVTVLQAPDPWTSAAVSAEIIAFVARTRGRVVLDDAAHVGDFRHDSYLARNQIRSVLCLPLINQGQLSGILYLENNLTPGVFTAERMELLTLLSTQMALALDHARLYHSLEAKVAERTRKLAEAKEAAEVARKAAEDANQAKNIFLASMNHELRSPLNAILGFSALMQREARAGLQPLTSSQLQNLGRIQRSGEHLLTLITNVLDRSTLEAGRLTITPTSVDLAALLDEVAQMFALMAAEKGLWLRVERDPQLPRRIRTDVVRLRQVLINLLSNAIKFTEEGGVTVAVALRLADTPASEAGQLWFEVADTGPGITPEDLPRLFEAFAQRGSAHARAGAGLGLSISHEIVRLLGGELTARSIAGGGTRFRFALPAQAVTAEELPAPEAERRTIVLAPGQPEYRILVADDNEPNRRLLRQILEPLGCEVREARDGAEALAIWQAWQPQLIWMDVRMPVLDGAAATRHIKATPQGQATRVIALTANVVGEEDAQELTAGYDAILRKPFREDELLALMERHLGACFVEEEGAASPQDPAPLREALAGLGAGLARLPRELLARLEQAALAANMTVVEELVAESEGHDAAVAQRLGAMASQFDYSRIWQLIQAFQQETHTS